MFKKISFKVESLGSNTCPASDSWNNLKLEKQKANRP